MDFSTCPINRLKMYGGVNGNKIGISFNGETYMLKFPPYAKLNPLMSYANSCISEDISCKIYKSLGIEAQDTMLGTYQDKVVVACKDFEVDGYRLKDFAFLKNTIIDSEQNGYGTELEDILETIESQHIMDKKVLQRRFWDMFIVDTLLGNFDRHNGNWGFLVNEDTQDVRLAPVYDCGSCLYPQSSDEDMRLILTDQDKITDRLYKFPTSAIRSEHVKINYFHFLCNTTNPECLKSLHNITKKIDMKKIDHIIDSTPYTTELHRKFLKTMLRYRKERILDKAMEIQPELFSFRQTHFKL